MTQHRALGHIYVIQFSNGRVKVGCSAKVHDRIEQHRLAALHFGAKVVDSWISPAHLEYRKSEARLIRACSEVAKSASGREYFSLPFREAVGIAEGLGITASTDADIAAWDARDQRRVDALAAVLGYPTSIVAVPHPAEGLKEDLGCSDAEALSTFLELLADGLTSPIETDESGYHRGSVINRWGKSVGVWGERLDGAGFVLVSQNTSDPCVQFTPSQARDLADILRAAADIADSDQDTAELYEPTGDVQ